MNTIKSFNQSFSNGIEYSIQGGEEGEKNIELIKAPKISLSNAKKFIEAHAKSTPYSEINEWYKEKNTFGPKGGDNRISSLLIRNKC